MRLHVLVACVSSIGIHLGFLLLLPAPSWQPLRLEPAPSDVELVETDVPEPQVLRPLPPELPPSPQPPPPPPNIPTYDADKIAQPNMPRIDGAIEDVSAGVSMQLAMPELHLPARTHTEDLAASLPLPEPGTAEVVAALLEPSSLVPGQPEAPQKQIGLGQVRLGDKQSPSRLAWPELQQPLFTPPLPAALPEQPALPPVPQFGIQGPVATREPVSQPEPPEVIVRAESEIVLKFWVRPDGVVSRVLPVRKGDTALEAAAIRYLEGWRFTPLPPHEPQEEQWGTITVRFLLPQR